jgi:hypothetical protein
MFIRNCGAFYADVGRVRICFPMEQSQKITYQFGLANLNLAPSLNGVDVILNGEKITMIFCTPVTCCKHLGVGSNLPYNYFFPAVIAAVSISLNTISTL